MKIFVAGGTGFIGSNFVLFLRSFGFHVDYCSSTSVWKDDKKYDLNSNVLQLVDLSEYETVIHCAAFTGGIDVIKKHPDKLVSENTRITLDLLENAARSKVKQFVFISSSAVYPSSFEALSEDSGFVGDPDPAFFGPGWMKRYCEKLCTYYYQQYGMKMLIIRPSNVYGPSDHFNEKSHVIPSLIMKFTNDESPVQVLGSPYVLRDFIFINDFLNIVTGLMLSSNIVGLETFNASTGLSVYMSNLACYIRDIIDKKKEFIFTNPTATTRIVQKINCSKFYHSGVTRYIQQTLQEGLIATVEYYNTLRKAN